MTSMNPTLRGFLLILAVAAAITALGAEASLYWVLLVLRILFIVAIVYALYRLWRNYRHEIALWQTRSQAVFYAAAGLAVANLLLSFLPGYPSTGLEALIFFGVFGACAFAMWRVWREEHTYGV